MAFLRTQPGERWIADTAVSVLKMWVLKLSSARWKARCRFLCICGMCGLRTGRAFGWTCPEATLRIGAGALLRGHLLVEELRVLNASMPRVPESRQPIRRLRRPIPLSCCGLLPAAVGFGHCGYLKLATVGELRIERFRLGQAVAGIPIEATLEGSGPLTDFRSELESTLYRPQIEKAGGRLSRCWPLSGALNLGNEGNWLSDGVKRPQPEERPDAGGAGSAACRPSRCRKWRRRGAGGAGCP